jgi:putative membrane protein
MMRVCSLLGLLVLGLAWLGGLEAFVPGPFAAHMSMHMAVVAVAAPLIALGLSGGRWDPVCRAPALFPPILASILELVVVWSWHTPLLHGLARQHPAAFVAEQGSFFASGLWLWLAAFGGPRHGQSQRAGPGMAALLLTSMHMTLLGALLALPPRALFAHQHAGAHGGHAHSLTPLDDQHLGGAIMLVFGGAAYLLGGLWLALGLLRSRRGQAGASEVQR